MAAVNDKPTVHLVLADLENEVKKPEPLVVVLANSKRITFKDPYDFKISERSELLDIFEAAKRGEANDLDLLKRIMSDEDYKRYIAADPSIRTHAKLVEYVMEHFQGGLGEPGKGKDSAS